MLHFLWGKKIYIFPPLASASFSVSQSTYLEILYASYPLNLSLYQILVTQDRASGAMKYQRKHIIGNQRNWRVCTEKKVLKDRYPE